MCRQQQIPSEFFDKYLVTLLQLILLSELSEGNKILRILWYDEYGVRTEFTEVIALWRAV
jgi:hypothetical protein